MKTIGIIRLHRWITAGTFVYDKLAEFVDGLLFYYNNLCCPELLHMATSHPKCIGARKDPNNWSENSHIDAGHLSQHRCMKWADEIKPKTVFIFDEDQTPPDRMLEEMDRWDDSGAPVIRFKWIWCWDTPHTIIAQYACPCVWFTQGYKWHPNASRCMPSSGNSIPYFGGQGTYDCRYPGRNLGVMTEDIRSWRTEKKPGWWLNEPFQLEPYNPDMTLLEHDMRNIPNELDRLFFKYGSDKHKKGLGKLYEKHISHLRKPNILEIGIKKGASLRAWLEYFPGANVVGVDIQKVEVLGTTVCVGNQNDGKFMHQIGKELGPFDIIIDDGSHKPEDQIVSFNALYKTALKPGGLYCIEDGDASIYGWVDIGIPNDKYKDLMVIRK